MSATTLTATTGGASEPPSAGVSAMLRYGVTSVAVGFAVFVVTLGFVLVERLDLLIWLIIAALAVQWLFFLNGFLPALRQCRGEIDAGRLTVIVSDRPTGKGVLLAIFPLVALLAVLVFVENSAVTLLILLAIALVGSRCRMPDFRDGAQRGFLGAMSGSLGLVLLFPGGLLAGHPAGVLSGIGETAMTIVFGLMVLAPAVTALFASIHVFRRAAHAE
ncbi:MAG: hypothetical protein AAF968_20050 [Pseudomonadota bacterium]